MLYHITLCYIVVLFHCDSSMYDRARPRSQSAILLLLLLLYYHYCTVTIITIVLISSSLLFLDGNPTREPAGRRPRVTPPPGRESVGSLFLFDQFICWIRSHRLTPQSLCLLYKCVFYHFVLYQFVFYHFVFDQSIRTEMSRARVEGLVHPEGHAPPRAPAAREALAH